MRALNFKTKQRHVVDSNFIKQESFYECHNKLSSYLRGGMDADNALACTHHMPWNRLSQKLVQIGLIPFDVGGDGDCFFKSVSHQLYGVAHFHTDIRMAGISYLRNHPELELETMCEDSWVNYLRQM